MSGGIAVGGGEGFVVDVVEVNGRELTGFCHPPTTAQKPSLRRDVQSRAFVFCGFISRHRRLERGVSGGEFHL